MTDTTATAPETRRFEAEVSQVLHLVTHALYSHKEIFLRELISNASDACDKLRFESIAKPELAKDDPELAITVTVDKEAKTLTIADNGIGMRREEVVENIGTIARSGTKRFLEAMSGDQRKDAQLIGQFGVGFYSAFIVADRVTLETRRADARTNEAIRWVSAGTGEYTIENIERATRGTSVTLHLKDEETEFLEDWRLRDLIAKYSDHIGFPIRMDDATVNHASALWTRPKSELSDEDYQAFYKHLAHADADALAWSHNRVEGNQSYTSLLYVPSRSPWDSLFTGRDERKGLKLYIRRVFIMDASEQLLPSYLRFVRGVVDSDDLPLNVSREILQENRLVQQIRSGATKRVLDLLDKIASDDKEKYQSFVNEFGNVLKEGLGEDFANRERIAKLLRFASTQSEGAARTVSLDEYVARMKEGQDAIYYVTAETYAMAKGSPAIEALKARGVEVLLMYDRIDEWMVSYLHEFAGKPLRNVMKGDLDLSKLGGAEEDAKAREAEANAAPIVSKIKGLLGDRVREVRVSRRLTDTPSVLVLDEQDIALHMQRLLREAGHDVPATKPVLEINATHPLVAKLDQEVDGERAEAFAMLLLEMAQIAEGGQLDDPSAFLKRVTGLIGAA